MRVNYVCNRCGSSDVCRDAWAGWDTENQEWVLDNVFDYAYCGQCESETTLVEAELKDGG